MKTLILTSLVLLVSVSGYSQSLVWQKASGTRSQLTESGKGYLVVKSTPSLFILPENPNNGDRIGFYDVTGTFSETPFTIDPGIIPIDGEAGLKVFKTTRTSVVLVYSSKNSEWTVISSEDGKYSYNSSSEIFITPKAFGAAGDGVTDDFWPLTKFFTFITTYGVKGKFESNREYYSSRRIEVIIDNNLFIDFRNSSIITDYADFTNNWQEIIYFGQKAAFTKKLMQDVTTTNSFKIKVDSYSNIKIGMGVRLAGDYYHGSGSGTFNKAILSTISDTLGDGWLLLADSIPYTFKKDDFFAKGSVSFYQVHNIEIKNLVVNLTGDSDDLKYDVYNIEMENLFDAKIKNITINKPLRFGLRGRSFYNCTLDSVIINYSPDLNGSIYGFGIELFVNTLIKNSNFSSYSVSVTSAKYPSYGLTWDNCTFLSYHSLGYDSHGDRDIAILNSTLYGARFVFGRFEVENCDIYSSKSNDYILEVVKSPLEILITKCNFLDGKGKLLVKEGNIGEFNSDNSLVFDNNKFYSNDLSFSFLQNVIYKDNLMVTNGSSFKLPDTHSRQPKTESYYSGFSEGNIKTTCDLDGTTAFSAIVKSKFDSKSMHCFLSDKSGNIFFWRFRDNNTIELRFKNSVGENPTLKFRNVHVMDTLWHTYAFTLNNDTAKLYIDGLHAQTILTKFSAMQSYPRLVNIGQRGSSDGVDNISSVLIFNKNLTPELIAKYSVNPRSGINKAKIALLERKTEFVWLDDSGNENNGTIGKGIILK